ncbi:MAG: hydroxymethylbilane synthase [Chlamydiae bacterium CG10_big_fil_rev_8_21_14_0_10_35_9]|nr:MAG: hydroxymethylbilane synthase [Chlamydiae bacterium CG10_big_fil_rev_8_21_14_0_10_35_9]
MAARDSNLSKAQVKEIVNKLKKIASTISFDFLFLKSSGDLDLKTSLRVLGKTDFFTKEVDQSLFSRRARVAVHSAKDLPEKIPSGLTIVAITDSVDNRDSLVLRPGESFLSLKSGAVIATSSERREEMVKRYRKDLSFIDLRGTIEKRLSLLQEHKADGVVVAEAALIRLKKTGLNRFIFNDSTVEGQGQLAILARSDDQEMVKLFEKIH